MTIHEKIKASEYIIFSDIEILVVLDFDPITKGHVLILPQNLYKDIDEIPEQILNKIFKVAQLYVKVVKSKYFVKGYSIMQNGGDFNAIDVFHLHLIPRFKEDEFGYKKGINKEIENVQELRKLMELEIKKRERVE